MTEKEPQISDREEQYCPDLGVREFIVREGICLVSCSLAHAVLFSCMPVHSTFNMSCDPCLYYSNLFETWLCDL